MSRKQRLIDTLSTLHPEYLSVEDESAAHQRSPKGETHFKIIVVSKEFEALSALARHRLVHKLLESELQQGLHALSLHLFTSHEWNNKKNHVLQSPLCQRGR